jgi:hypothetical protein
VVSFRASVRTAGLVAGIAALLLGLFAGSAFAWYNCKGSSGNDETPTVPTSSNGPPGHSEKGDNDQKNEDQPGGGEKPGEESQPAPPPVVESTPAPGPVPVATGVLPAAPHPAAAVSPAPTPAPTTPAAATPPVVKGEIGTVRNASGGEVPIVLAASGEVGQSAGQGRGLARTGFGLLPVAILGGIALGGSAFFFRRLQGC